jgi:hypothetical protein
MTRPFITVVLLIIAATLFNCSSDSTPQTETTSFSKMERKSISYINSSGELFDNGITSDSIVFLLNSNKIISYSGLVDMDHIEKMIHGELEYQNNKLYKITQFEDNALLSTLTYHYDDNGDLSEMFSEPTYSPVKSKLQFVKQNDTIYVKRYFSENDAPYVESYDSPLYKIVMDENENRIFYGNSQGTSSYEYLYENNNLVSLDYINGTHNYTYGSAINSENYILKNTLGKQHLAIFFDRSSLRLMNSYVFPLRHQYINEQIITAFNLATQQLAPYEIEHEINDSNFSTKTTISQWLNGNLRTIYETRFIE